MRHNRRVLSVVEAKREDLDPYDAKEQARGYAENLNAPFVILSNGREHWFWNYERADQRDAYRIERLPSREDLERIRLKNLQPPRPLTSEIISPDYLRHLKYDLTLRRYQIGAIDEIARLFDCERLRKFLLEMATGTGKTLLCAALIRRFLQTRNAERVLFIVDRIELAKQTMEEFAVVLPEFKPVIYKTARRSGELLGASVVVATIQSLMTDRRYREEFTPFYFDLVINDEAHLPTTRDKSGRLFTVLLGTFQVGASGPFSSLPATLACRRGDNAFSISSWPRPSPASALT